MSGRKSKIDADLKRRYEFFKKHAGTVVGKSAETAMYLARAERLATDLEWEVKWEHDPEGEDTLGEIDPAEVDEILIAVLYDAAGEVIESIGGVVDPDRNYGRVVEAELAAEALARKGLL